MVRHEESESHDPAGNPLPAPSAPHPEGSNSPAPPATAAGRAQLLKFARNAFSRFVFSYFTQMKEAGRLKTWHSWTKMSQLVLSAVTTGGFVAIAAIPDSANVPPPPPQADADAAITLPSAGRISIYVGGLASIALLILNGITKSYDFGTESERHLETGKKLWVLREAYLTFISDLETGDLSLDRGRLIRDELTAKLGAVYEGAPLTSLTAHRWATRAMQKDEELILKYDQTGESPPSEMAKDKPKGLDHSAEPQ